MRKRTFNINVRVTESEKKRLMRTAKRCGLSLSEYLRKVGLNKKLSEKPNEKLYEVYALISDLRRDFHTIQCYVFQKACTYCDFCYDDFINVFLFSGSEF